MASLAVFTPYTDQENVTDAGRRKIRAKSDSAPLRVGKTFQSNVSQTPLRRALGVVNRSNELKPNGLQQQKQQHKTFEKPCLSLQTPTPSCKQPNPKSEKPTLSLQPPAPASKPPKPQAEKPKTGKAPMVMAKEVLGMQNKVVVYMDNEIEKMGIPKEETMEEFEDVWPASENPPTAYLPQLLAWRDISLLCPYSDDTESWKTSTYSDNEDDLCWSDEETEMPCPMSPVPHEDVIALEPPQDLEMYTIFSNRFDFDNATIEPL